MVEKEKIDALNGAIEKWNGIITEEKTDGGMADCPLCQKYHKRSSYLDNCRNCPIYAITGKNYCCGTPYEKLLRHIEMDHYIDYDSDPHLVCDTCVDFATSFRDFIVDVKNLCLIDAAIKKWERVLSGEQADNATEDCPLCHEYLDDRDCSNCPVKHYTGDVLCGNTPYIRWWQHHAYTHDKQPRSVECPKCQEICEDIITFIKTMYESYKEHMAVTYFA